MSQSKYIPAPTIELYGTQYDAAGNNLGVQTVTITGGVSKYIPINSDGSQTKSFTSMKTLYFGTDLTVTISLTTLASDSTFYGDSDYALRTGVNANIPVNGTVFYGDLAGILNDSPQAVKAEIRYTVSGKPSSRTKFYRWRDELSPTLKFNKSGSDNTLLMAKTHFKGVISETSVVNVHIVSADRNTFDNTNSIATNNL